MLEYDKGLEVTFQHELDPETQESYIAFCYPWSYEEDQELIQKYENKLKDDDSIYFQRELIC